MKALIINKDCYRVDNMKIYEFREHSKISFTNINSSYNIFLKINIIYHDSVIFTQQNFTFFNFNKIIYNLL